MSQEPDSKVQPSTKRMPPNAGKGRVAGVPNKTTGTLKEAILKAAAISGAKIDPGASDGLVAYLVDIADNHKKVMGGLISRVLPTEIGIDKESADALQALAEAIEEGRRRAAARMSGKIGG